MKTWGFEVQLHTFLNLPLDIAVWSALGPGHFTLGGRAPRIHGLPFFALPQRTGKKRQTITNILWT
jgi:hypothetical protein